ACILSVSRVPRCLRPPLLEHPDHLRRITDRTPVHLQDGHRAARAQAPRRELLERGRHRAAYVRDPLVVERPPGLLVVVRDLEVPEDRRLYGGPLEVSVSWRHHWFIDTPLWPLRTQGHPSTVPQGRATLG